MRLRLIVSFALIVLVSVTLVVIIARLNAATEVRAFMFRGGMTRTSELVTALQDFYQVHGSWEGVENLLSSPGRGYGWGPGGSQGGMGMRGMGGGMMMGQRLRLADAQGRLIADTSGERLVGQLSPEAMETALPLLVNGRVVGYLLAESGMTFTPSDESYLLNRISRAAVTAGLIAGGFSLLLALFLAYQLLRPVRELTGAVARLGAGDLSQRVKVSGNDELALLGRAFNRMADSLQRMEQSRRAMTADIAHELRNPLAVQLANLEALQDGVYPLTPENLQPILEQNRLLNHLVEDLRTLALADAGQIQLERVPVDWVEFVSKVVERHKPQADMRQISLDISDETASQPLQRIPLDPMRVEQILNNLLSNALRYTPQGGRIEIRLARSPKGALVSIHDSGPGIPPDALPHVFERFYRADRSRSRAEGGSGLGLAIAHHLAEAHGGTLTAANHPNGGAIFTLTLPLA